MPELNQLKAIVLKRLEEGDVKNADRKLHLLEGLDAEQTEMLFDVMAICADSGRQEGYEDGFADGELSERQKHKKVTSVYTK